jgi:hypothetical protein
LAQEPFPALAASHTLAAGVSKCGGCIRKMGEEHVEVEREVSGMGLATILASSLIGGLFNFKHR